MNCPICDNELIPTEHKNKIFELINYSCSSCGSLHVTEEVDTSEYYAKEYHTKFSYNNFLASFINKFSLISNRTAGRFDFLEKNSKIEKNSNFLEIGGTTGELYNIIRKKLHSDTFIIIEPNPEFNRTKPGLKFINCLIEQIKISDIKDVDVLIMFHVLEHIYDLDKFFEMLKQIKPLKFYFEVPNCENEKVLMDSLYNNPHYHHFTKSSLELLFKKHGFEKEVLQIIEPVSYHPYKKVGRIKRYQLRFSGNNEKELETGLYLRGIFSIK